MSVSLIISTLIADSLIAFLPEGSSSAIICKLRDYERWHIYFPDVTFFFCCCLILPTSRHTSDENNYLT